MNSNLATKDVRVGTVYVMACYVLYKLVGITMYTEFQVVIVPAW